MNLAKKLFLGTGLIGAISLGCSKSTKPDYGSRTEMGIIYNTHPFTVNVGIEEKSRDIWVKTTPNGLILSPGQSIERRISPGNEHAYTIWKIRNDWWVENQADSLIKSGGFKVDSEHGNALFQGKKYDWILGTDGTNSP